VQAINFVRVIPGGRAESSKELWLDLEEYKGYVESLQRLKTERRIGTGYLKHFETFEFLLDPKLRGSKVCNAATSNIGIRSDLKVTPCLALVGYVLGDLRQSPLKEILSSGRTKAFLEIHESEKMDEACRACRHFSFCKGGCRAHAFYSTKNIAARDPGCWL